MKKLLLSVTALLVLGCSDSTEVKQDVTPPTAISIKGMLPKSRTLPTVTHVAAIPITAEYSAAYITENLTPIAVLEDGSFHIEGIEKDIVVILLDIQGSTTKVVDLVALQQNGEDLLLLPLENVAPKEIDLGTLSLSSTTAISSLLPATVLDSLSSGSISEIATLDDIYRNIENHINNSKKSVDGAAKEKQVFYLKPEIAIRNSMTDLYNGVNAGNMFTSANIDYHLLQFSTLPIEMPITAIGSNFSIQSPSGVSYTCPDLNKQGEVVQEGDDIFVRRYSAGTDEAHFMVEYVWATAADAEAENSNHIGNVNFFRVESGESFWVPERGSWNYLWQGTPYGNFDVSFAQPFDTQNRFEGYIPVPSIVKGADDKLESVSIAWYKQQNGVLTPLADDKDIAEKLITSMEVEVSTQTYKDGSFHESSIHIGDAGMTGVTVPSNIHLIGASLIDSESNVTETSSLQDGKAYADALWVMYELGNELKFSFVWNLHISQE